MSQPKNSATIGFFINPKLKKRSAKNMMFKLSSILQTNKV